jgi:hypothetical protein
MADYIFVFVMTFTGVVSIAAWVYRPSKPVPQKPEKIKDQLSWHRNVGTVWNG